MREESVHSIHLAHDVFTCELLSYCNELFDSLKSKNLLSI